MSTTSLPYGLQTARPDLYFRYTAVEVELLGLRAECAAWHQNIKYVESILEKLLRLGENGQSTVSNWYSSELEFLQSERAICSWGMRQVKLQRLRIEEEHAAIHWEWMEWVGLNGEQGPQNSLAYLE
ncbi:hypothetical protein L211DRAFT_891977 [Terfezia boudieri ATCC MYA-4762]|uniref:Uncharacterized protein n=1 Tax=Terfezia boudieri ATCC MYA-4762 TaxID=1051890 RepID=A0A3N4M2F6_9PEZI|nr:hypothetical protein L211DRAFT_891977 [Terfezia boudieri ATCC MYA-4762]